MLPDLLNPRCLENFELKRPCPSPCISTRSEQFTRKFKYLNVLLLKKNAIVVIVLIQRLCLMNSRT